MSKTGKSLLIVDVNCSELDAQIQQFGYASRATVVSAAISFMEQVTNPLGETGPNGLVTVLGTTKTEGQRDINTFHFPTLAKNPEIRAGSIEVPRISAMPGDSVSIKLTGQTLSDAKKIMARLGEAGVSDVVDRSIGLLKAVSPHIAKSGNLHLLDRNLVPSDAVARAGDKLEGPGKDRISSPYIFPKSTASALGFLSSPAPGSQMTPT